MHRFNVLRALTSTAVIVAVFPAIAFGRSFEVSSQTVRANFTSIEFNGLAGNATCSLTLEGSFHARTIAKTSSALIGYINRARLGACSSGAATVLSATLPWHTRYASFTGTLPNITRLATTVIGAAWAIREFGGITCLLRSTSSNPMRVEYGITGGAMLNASIGGSIPTGGECFGVTAELRSAIGIVHEGGVSTITIRLI